MFLNRATEKKHSNQHWIHEALQDREVGVHENLDTARVGALSLDESGDDLFSLYKMLLLQEGRPLHSGLPYCELQT